MDKLKLTYKGESYEVQARVPSFELRNTLRRIEKAVTRITVKATGNLLRGTSAKNETEAMLEILQSNGGVEKAEEVMKEGEAAELAGDIAVLEQAREIIDATRIKEDSPLYEMTDEFNGLRKLIPVLDDNGDVVPLWGEQNFEEVEQWVISFRNKGRKGQ